MVTNKDFYRNLPGMVCIMLDKYITKYRKEPWFPEAWEEYRQHILNSSMDDMKMPGYVFNKYVKKKAIRHFAAQDSRYELFHKDGDVFYGVPQQKKFPLPDADHVRSAIKFFNYVEPKYEAQLAKAILKRAEMYNVDLSEMNIGDENRFKKYLANNELKHYGTKGMKWGIRRYENYDGTLTPEGRKRYGRSDTNNDKKLHKLYKGISANISSAYKKQSEELYELDKKRSKELDKTVKEKTGYKTYYDLFDAAVEQNEMLDSGKMKYSESLWKPLHDIEDFINEKYEAIENKVTEQRKKEVRKNSEQFADEYFKNHERLNHESLVKYAPNDINDIFDSLLDNPDKYEFNYEDWSYSKKK